MTSTVRPAPPAPAERVREFGLTLARDRADPDRYRVILNEIQRPGAFPRTVATASPHRIQYLSEHLVTAVRSSGLRPSVLSPARRAPVWLDEAAGVRLGLILLAAAPLARPDRSRRVAAGIAGMSEEETYYWYALCSGPRCARARQALRVLLSEG